MVWKQRPFLYIGLELSLLTNVLTPMLSCWNQWLTQEVDSEKQKCESSTQTMHLTDHHLESTRFGISVCCLLYIYVSIYLYPSCLHQLKVAYMWISLYFSYPVLWPSLDTTMSLGSSHSLFLSLYQTGFLKPFILYQFSDFLSLNVGSWKGSACPFFAGPSV